MSGKAISRTRRSNIQDIAKKCGIHPSTVSSVLAGNTKQRRISALLAEQVLAAAAELDYSPNLLVHSIMSGRTHNMAFFNGFREHRRGDVYIDALKLAVERAAGLHGYDITVCCDFSRTPADTYKNLNGGRSDGLILFKPLDDDPLLEHLRKSRMPVLLLSAVDSEGVLSSVCEDQGQGVRLIAENLLAFGHRRIAILARDGGFAADSVMRVRLLRTLLSEQGVEVPDRWVIAQGEQMPLAFMEELDPPTAVFCWHDQLGYRFLDKCLDAGIRVPEDLSVVGYDGLAWPARTPHQLASVFVDLDLLGQMAVETLDALITGKATTPVVQMLPVSFDAGTTLLHRK